MRNLIKTLAATVLIAGAAGFAHAADAIDEVPVAPEANDVVTAPGGWDGAYVGGKATYQWGKVKSGADYDAQGLGAGLYGGYNMQNGQIVYGGEADLNYSGIDATHAGVTTKQRLNGSVRGRIGYDLEPALVYGTAGLAATNLKASDATSSTDKNLLGLTVGAGVETKITESITARAEYRFNNYQTQTFNLDSGATDRGLKEHQINLGLGVRF
ncbi:outer membrane protein [Rhizobium alvei]|jgi:outer membrane immunogenic protein|uniref:Porin family protein n=1 Tax=Rhizobium alvei TaxID=1132659 RepID=A0ABT8YJ58_9HYPH|nr:outer membrane protein [Rhizobium alvei]MDO6963720.1 porin family protein [Rhizobium alvei]